MLTSTSFPTSSLRAISFHCCFTRTYALRPPGKRLARQRSRCLGDCISSTNLPRSVGVGVGLRSDKLPNHSRHDDGFLKDLEKQLEQFLAEILNMLKRGDKDEAADILLANYEATKEQIDNGNKGIEQVATLDIVALGYMAAGELKFVEHLLDMLMEMTGGLSDDSRLLDSVLIHMGSMYTNLGKFNEALFVYNRALSIIERLFGKKSPFLVFPILGKAKVFISMGKSSNAIEAYEESIKLLEVNRGHEIEELVMPLSALGTIFIDEGRVTDAESCFVRILSIYKKTRGEADGRVGMARCFLARALSAKGNVEEAIKQYEDGLRIVQNSKYMALDDDVLQKMRVELAELLQLAGRLQEGRELLEESLLIAERSKGKAHPSLVTYLLNLSQSYSHSKNYVEAERLVRVALQLMPKEVDPGGLDITVPKMQLAFILYSQRRDSEAESIALQVLHSREEAFGKDSLPACEALDFLTDVQIRLGKDDLEMVEQLKRVLEIQEKELGSESEYVMDTLRKIIFFLDKMGRRDEKSPLLRRLSVLRKKYKQKILIEGLIS